MHLLLAAYDLKEPATKKDSVNSVFDSKIYKRFQSKKPSKRIISLTLFADGVEKLNQKFYTIMAKVNELDCTARSRAFLSGAALSSKPNLEQFLSELISELNELWENGVFAKKFGGQVYPYLHSFLLDGVARPDFLHLSHHGAKHFCTGCYVEGRVVAKGDGHSRIYHYREEFELRKHRDSQSIVDKIQDGNILPSDLPYYGFKGRSPLFDIKHFNTVKQIPPLEPMHTYLGGTVLRDFTSMQSPANKQLPCFLSSAQRDVLQQRMNKVHLNKNFKRTLGSFRKLNKWKTNQFADFFFNIGPSVFRSILSQEAYGHYLISVYLISRVWIGGVELAEVDDLKLLVQQYLAHHTLVYPLTDQTSNHHSFQHLIDTFLNIGPLKDQTAFLFEAMNGECTKLLKGPNAILEQLASRSSLSFLIQLNDKNLQPPASDRFQVKGRARQIGAKCYHRAIKKDGLHVTCSRFNTSRTKKDFYIIDENNKCFSIRAFFVVGREIFCEAFEIILGSNIAFRINSKERSVPHIYTNCSIQSQLVEFNVESIREKVLFIQNFDQGSSNCSNVLKGDVIRSIHPFFN